MDRGISATWYDLPEQGKNEYIDWLHSSYIPSMLARPGYLWAAHVENIMTPEREAAQAARLVRTTDTSVPTGNQYLLLFGTVSPHVLADPSPNEMLAEATAETRQMLARQASPRSCLFVEADRVDGPAVKKRAPGITPGPIIQLGTFNSNKLENEVEMSTWYSRSRLPLIGGLPGAVGARKLVSIAGWAKHAILYEFESLAAAATMVDHSDWTNRAVGNLVHAPHSPSLGVRIWPK